MRLMWGWLDAREEKKILVRAEARRRGEDLLAVRGSRASDL